MTVGLHIRLLGGFSVQYNGKPLAALDTSRSQSLLAYLLLHRGAPISRQNLAYLFWPDSSDSQARANLRHLLHSLRTNLPEVERYLQADVHTLHWLADAPFSSDVVEFEDAAREGSSIDRLQEGIRLYAGELLPSCYEDWILPERERLRQIYENALEKLIQVLEDNRAYTEAIGYTQRLLQHDPLHEGACRRLMRLHSLNGDRASALRAYHVCATALHRELGVEPSATTQQVYERLLNIEASQQKPAPNLKLTLPLLGREVEWSKLRSAWQEASRGEPRLELITGEAGMGKTRLAEELLDWAARQGFPVAAASAYASGRNLAYAPVSTWLRALPLSGLEEVWLIEIARLLPELIQAQPGLLLSEPLAEGWQRIRLFEALVRALLCNRPAQLLLLDDLQWCDYETLEWLGYLLRPGNPLLAGRRLMIVATLRPEEQDQPELLPTLLDDLERRGRLSRVEIGPLDQAATIALAEGLSGKKMDPAQAARLYWETEGNPLFVVETVRSPGKLSTPSSKIQVVINARLGQLSAASRELAEAAAVLGRQFTFEMIQHISGVAEDRLVQDLDELWRQRILREEGSDAYNFSHEKIREVAYGSLSRTRSRLLHQRAAEALEVIHSHNLDAAGGLIANHYEQAGQWEQGIQWYVRAGQAAQGIYALSDAVALFQKALNLLPPVQERGETWRAMEVQIWESLGNVHQTAGRLAEARECYESSLTLVPVGQFIQQAKLYCGIGSTYSILTRHEEALQAFVAAEAVLGAKPNKEDQQWWQVWLMVQLHRIAVYYFQGRVDELESLTDQIDPPIRQYGTLNQQIEFLTSVLMLNYWRERGRVSAETMSLSQKRFALKREFPAAHHQAGAYFVVGFTYLWYGDLENAEKHLSIALDQADKAGHARHKSLCFVYLAFLWRLRGDVERTEQFASRALSLAEAMATPIYVSAAMMNLAWVYWRRGDQLRARETAQAAIKLLHEKSRVYPFQWAAHLPLVAMDLEAGDFKACLRYTRAIQAPDQWLLPESIDQALTSAIQADDQGEKNLALEHLRRALTLAQESGYL